MYQPSKRSSFVAVDPASPFAKVNFELHAWVPVRCLNKLALSEGNSATTFATPTKRAIAHNFN